MTMYPVIGVEVRGQGLDSGAAAADPSVIAEQISDISNQLGSVFDAPLGLPLKSMDVALTVTAEGGIGFLGTGAKAGAEGSITLTFERIESPRGTT
jgi:hypothetical protein